MDAKTLVREWFDKWDQGDFLNLPLADDFKHTSPFGTIDGKEVYLNLVKENQDKFLGYKFTFQRGTIKFLRIKKLVCVIQLTKAMTSAWMLVSGSISRMVRLAKSYPTIILEKSGKRGN